MWLPRIVAAVRETERPVLLIGGEPFGAPFVIDALRQSERVAWFAATPERLEDPVGLGNALARAVNAALPGALLTPALPYAAHVRTLRRYREDVAPLWLVLSAERAAAPLVDDLVSLHGDGLRVLLDLREAPGARAADACTVLERDALRLLPEEARAVAPAALDDAAVEALWKTSAGRYAEFTSLVQRAAGLPRTLVPTADGFAVAEQDAVPVEPPVAVQALRREGEWIDALELAVLRVPEMVEDLLRSAGPRYQQEGLLARLHLLLSALPEAYARTERVLEWRLVAALAVGELGAVAHEVDEYLRTHRAPALRARRAGTLPRAQGFALAEQAVAEQRTPLTTWQIGRLHPDPERAIELLRESVRLAEEAGNRYEVARNADTLAARLYQAGRFASAASWSRWALDVFDRDQLQDGARRLLLVNDLAAARIMTGDLVGLRSVLESAQAGVEGAVPELAVLLGSTLAQLDLAERRPEEALEHFRATYHRAPRRARARYGYQLARVLVELERFDEARMVADDVSEIASGGSLHEASLAALARGIVAAVDGAATDAAGAKRAAAGGRSAAASSDGAADLARAMLDEHLPYEQRMAATLYYLLAAPGSAADVPPDLAEAVRAAHPVAIRVLAGPEHAMQPVLAMLAGGHPTLSLRFLGGVECRLDGRAIDLSARLAEVAAALALHPAGIGRDALIDFLSPEGRRPYSSSGMRAMLTRLRALLPVSEAPYRFAVPFTADVLEVRQHLAEGRVREAAAVRRGLLLPESDAPGIVEQRWALEEEIRQAALQTHDADVLFDLAEGMVEDLEFWQAAAAALPGGDPRVALARARARRLERAYGLGDGAADGVR